MLSTKTFKDLSTQETRIMLATILSMEGECGSNIGIEAKASIIMSDPKEWEEAKLKEIAFLSMVGKLSTHRPADAIVSEIVNIVSASYNEAKPTLSKCGMVMTIISRVISKIVADAEQEDLRLCFSNIAGDMKQYEGEE